MGIYITSSRCNTRLWQHILNKGQLWKNWKCHDSNNNSQKGKYLISAEKYNKHKITNQNLQLNDSQIEYYNPIFDILYKHFRPAFPHQEISYLPFPTILDNHTPHCHTTRLSLVARPYHHEELNSYSHCI